MKEDQREKFGSRLGFILISAGCAIGLGNVWRFPYICGEYGGAAFVVLYLVFLAILALPVLVMEFSVGRGSQKSIARAFDTLEPTGSKWHRFKWLGLAGNYLLMMFYTTVAGWMVSYMFKIGSGQTNGLDAAAISAQFDAMLANPFEMVGWMLVVTLLGLIVCSVGLRKGVERVTKPMMMCLIVVLGVLCLRAVTLEGAQAGLEFYLVPDFSKLFTNGWSTFGEAVYAAMGQAFFTLSIGVGSMAIFGSYIDKKHRLTGEALRVAGLDTMVALLAGLVIFPACFAFGVQPDSGPGLVFITLPSVFEQMWLGQVWGTLFFLFMTFASLSTVIAVFENIIAFGMDQWGLSRKKAVLYNGIALIVLALPCALGPNLLSGIMFPGIGDIPALEDFILSNNILPLGSLVFLMFCISRRGWGWKKFTAEADAGKGTKFPQWARRYLLYGLPVLIAIIFVMGYIPKFQIWFG
ncbi:MAG: sodium-dependent transporter [Raoultibacter sp.]